MIVHNINKEKARVLELSPLVQRILKQEAWTNTFSPDLSSTYKGLMKRPTHELKSRESCRANEAFENDQRYRGPNHRLFCQSVKMPQEESLAIRKESQKIYRPPRQLSHLVKGIKKERTKTSDNQRGKKKEKSTTSTEAPILMINQEEAHTRNCMSKSPTFKEREITFPLVAKGSNSSAPVIIKANIFEREVSRVHMDSDSSYEVIYEHCFLKLKPFIQASKVDSQVLLVGFWGEKSWAIGEVLLEITIGNAPLTRSKTLNFVIVKSNSPYNMLLGRTAMQKMGMVVSMILGAVKFHTTQGIKTMFSTHESNKIEGVNKVRETSSANLEGVLSCVDAEEKIIVNSKYPEQTVTIGKQLLERFKERLRNLLRTNADVFVWTHADMTGIPRIITVNGKPFSMEHKLNEYSYIKPIKQKRRSLGPDRSTAARKEVEELIRTGILREAVHQTWLANPVMVMKSDEGWRMCVDFTDINKACPKDYYPLPEIDWKVESLSRFRLKCFLDAYKGYHHIQMAEEDEDKTSFFTEE
ncbi:hypothetical protein Tco_1447037 [Tanacetum coccineum]